MKKTWITLCTAAILAIGVTGCASGNGSSQTPHPTEQSGAPSPTASPQATTPADGGTSGQEKQSPLFATPQDAAAAIILALKDADMETLQAFVHPQNGLLFSPYAHIDKEKAQTFPASELPTTNDDKKYVWGSFDGSGEPIELTFGDYYKKFVYDEDFVNAEKIGWDEILSSGNTEPNMKETFPGSYIVDYHFSGFDEQYEGMDWKSLILVLEQHEGGWYLSGIVHSQWTI